jgi:hypothetical protein
MLFAGTPLNQARAAIVQDLYHLAFVQQLEATNADASSACKPIDDAAIARLLREIAEVLDRTEHEEDAAILKSLAVATAPRRSPGGIRALIDERQRSALAAAPIR